MKKYQKIKLANAMIKKQVLYKPAFDTLEQIDNVYFYSIKFATTRAQQGQTSYPRLFGVLSSSLVLSPLPQFSTVDLACQHYFSFIQNPAVLYVQKNDVILLLNCSCKGSSCTPSYMLKRRLLTPS